MSPSRRVSLVCATSCTMALSAGAVILVSGNRMLGLWLILLGLIGAVIGTGFIVLGRQSMARAAALSLHHTEGSDYAFIHENTSVDNTMMNITPKRWVGSGSVPSPLGYVVVTQPLAVLEIRQTGLNFRVRPRIAGMLFGIEDLMVAPSDGAVVFPARKPGVVGIEVRMPGRPSYYFWTKQRNEVIAAAASVGLEISDQEQSMRRS